MQDDELSANIHAIFEIEPDEDGFFSREYPDPTLTDVYGFDFEYLQGFAWEGSTSHRSTRFCPRDEEGVPNLIKTNDVPNSLFEAALRLYGDSLLHYANEEKSATALRLYPPIILTFWSAFEAFVRRTSELLVLTCASVPPAVADYLREIEPYVDRKGNVKNRTKFAPVLDRYSVMLRYGFGLEVDRGNRFWQRLEAAKRLRDSYTHIEALTSRSLSDVELLDFLESTVLGIIWPSVIVRRSLLLGSLHLYSVLAQLKKLTFEYLPNGHVEEPLFHHHEWQNQSFLFYCPFTSVDENRFRTHEDQIGLEVADGGVE